jgi:hypothetical protein
MISNSDDSDSDSDSFAPYYKLAKMTSEFTIMTVLPHSSSVIYIGEQGKPPVITLAKLTPDLLFDFENGTYSYFSFKEVKPE